MTGTGWKNRRGDIDSHGMMNRGARGVGPVGRGVGGGRRGGWRPRGPLRVFPASRPVLVVGVFLHVYDPQPLGFLHVRPSVLRGQPSPFFPWKNAGRPSVSRCRNGATIFRYDIAERWLVRCSKPCLPPVFLDSGEGGVKGNKKLYE